MVEKNVSISDCIPGLGQLGQISTAAVAPLPFQLRHEINRRDEMLK